jgi:hypothetical protein
LIHEREFGGALEMMKRQGSTLSRGGDGASASAAAVRN